MQCIYCFIETFLHFSFPVVVVVVEVMQQILPFLHYLSLPRMYGFLCQSKKFGFVHTLLTFPVPVQIPSLLKTHFGMLVSHTHTLSLDPPLEKSLSFIIIIV